MPAPTQTFGSARSAAVLDQLQTVMAEMGRASFAELAQRVQLSQSQVALYVRELERKKLAHCCQGQQYLQGRTTSKLWAAGPHPEEDGHVGHTRRVIVRQTWPPLHVRDSLDCYLFGAPNPTTTRA